MTKEEKSLLLKDICARLPCGLMLRIAGHDVKITISNTWIYFGANDEAKEHIKPYLRPLSSMTEKEKKELLQISNFNPDVDDIYYDSIRCIERTLIDIADIANFISWLNAHHFDYRGLIEKGLALEAPKDMYN